MPKNVKKYLLEKAELYEKHGFFQDAAEIFLVCNRNKGRKLYVHLAKKAESLKFYYLAGDFYRNARKYEKAKKMFLKEAKILRLKGISLLAREAEDRAKWTVPKKETLQNKKMSKMAQQARKLSHKGKFIEFQGTMQRAAKYAEKIGELRSAAYFYLDSGNANEAERIWKKITQQKPAKSKNLSR